MEEKKYTLDQIYGMVNDFLKKYPFNISWRIKQHCKIIEKHLNSDEEIFYIFPAQKNTSSFDISSTVIVVFTNKRILIGQKKVLWGYNLLSITPDMFNDFEVYKGMISIEVRGRSHNLTLQGMYFRAMSCRKNCCLYKYWLHQCYT